MSPKDDGRNAFPLSTSDYDLAGTTRATVNGMTLRDYFAGKALPSCICVCRGDSHEGEDIEAYFARKSYAVADAMLAERAK